MRFKSIDFIEPFKLFRKLQDQETDCNGCGCYHNKIYNRVGRQNGLIHKQIDYGNGNPLTQENQHTVFPQADTQLGGLDLNIQHKHQGKEGKGQQTGNGINTSGVTNYLVDHNLCANQKDTADAAQ